MGTAGLNPQLRNGIIKTVTYIKPGRQVKSNQHYDGIPVALFVHRLMGQSPVPGTKNQGLHIDIGAKVQLLEWPLSFVVQCRGNIPFLIGVGKISSHGARAQGNAVAGMYGVFCRQLADSLVKEGLVRLVYMVRGHTEPEILRKKQTSDGQGEHVDGIPESSHIVSRQDWAKRIRRVDLIGKDEIFIKADVPSYKTGLKTGPKISAVANLELIGIQSGNGGGA